MPTYNHIRVQNLPVNYAGDLTIGTIEDASTAVLVYLYYNGLSRASYELSATSAVDGTVVVTIPTDNRLQRGHYSIKVVVAASYEPRTITVTYQGSEVEVWALELDTEMNCGDVDANITLEPSTEPVGCIYN